MVDMLSQGHASRANRRLLCARIIDAAESKGVGPRLLAGAWSGQDRRLWLVDDLEWALLHWIDHEIDIVTSCGVTLLEKLHLHLDDKIRPSSPYPIADNIFKHCSYLEILEAFALETETAEFGSHRWSRQLHRLLKENRRQRAAELLWIGYDIAYHRAPGLGEVWVEHVMPLAMPQLIGIA